MRRVTSLLFAVMVFVLAGASTALATQKWHGYFSVKTNETPMVGDFNGDGMTDIVTFTRDNPDSVGDVWVSLSEGIRFGDGETAEKWSDWFAVSKDQTVVIGDFNGDGKDDFATWLGTSTREVYVALSNGVGMEDPVVWLSIIGDTSSDIIRAGDVNGDGKDDIVCFYRSQGKVYVALSNGVEGFDIPFEWHSYFAVSTYERPYVADVNGDGYADIITFCSSSPLSQGAVYVALSNRESMFGDSELWSGWFCASETEQPIIADLDGDGIPEWLTVLQNGQVYVAKKASDGNYLESGTVWGEGFYKNSSDQFFVGDPNGDGKAEMIIFRQDEGKVYVTVSHESPSGEETAGINISPKTGKQRITFKVDENGFIDGIVTSDGEALYPDYISNIVYVSDTVGWSNGIQADFDPENLEVEISGVPTSDTGTWKAILDSSSNNVRWLMLEKFETSGTVTDSDLVSYGTEQKPAVSFDTDSGNGQVTVSFNETALVGLSTSGIDASDISYMVWESQATGKKNYATLGTDSAGKYQTGFTGMLRRDKGKFFALTTGGKIYQMVLSKWNFEGTTVVTDSSTGVVEYGGYKGPEVSFDTSSGTATVYFNTDYPVGLSSDADISQVVSGQWNSGATGWSDNATLTGSLLVDGNGNYYFTISGMYSSDRGNFCLKMSDGTYKWFAISKWTYSGVTVTQDDTNGVIEYGGYADPQIAFDTSSGTATIYFNSSYLRGLSTSVSDPSTVVRVQWNSSTVGWSDNSTAYGTLTTDGNGNYYATVSGMPTTDTGNFALQLTNSDGTYSYAWFSISDWAYSGATVSVDDTEGLITY